MPLTDEQLQRIVNDALARAHVPDALADWMDDFRGAAALGVAEALDHYDAPTASLILARAHARVVDEVRAEARRRGVEYRRDGGVGRNQQSTADPYRLADEVIDDHEPDPPATLATDELIAQAQRLARDLPADEREAIARLYSQGQTLDEAARAMQCSRRHVARLRDDALAVLRDAMEGGEQQ